MEIKNTKAIKELFEALEQMYKVQTPTNYTLLQVLEKKLENVDFSNMQIILKKLYDLQKKPRTMSEAIQIYLDIQRANKPQTTPNRPHTALNNSKITEQSAVPCDRTKGGREYQLYLDLLHFKKITNNTSISSGDLFEKIKFDLKKLIDSKNYNPVITGYFELPDSTKEPIYKLYIKWDSIQDEVQEIINLYI
jgi:hypothetical protein